MFALRSFIKVSQIQTMITRFSSYRKRFRRAKKSGLRVHRGPAIYQQFCKKRSEKIKDRLVHKIQRCQGYLELMTCLFPPYAQLFQKQSSGAPKNNFQLSWLKKTVFRRKLVSWCGYILKSSAVYYLHLLTNISAGVHHEMFWWKSTISIQSFQLCQSWVWCFSF